MLGADSRRLRSVFFLIHNQNTAKLTSKSWRIKMLGADTDSRLRSRSLAWTAFHMKSFVASYRKYSNLIGWEQKKQKTTDRPCLKKMAIAGQPNNLFFFWPNCNQWRSITGKTTNWLLSRLPRRIVALCCLNLTFISEGSIKFINVSEVIDVIYTAQW